MLMNVLMEAIAAIIPLACAIIQWVVITVAASLVTLVQAPLIPVMVSTKMYYVHMYNIKFLYNSSYLY